MLRGDDGQLYVDICAHRDFVRGEEVLLPYGLETSADLLCSHGIVLEHNDADYVPVYSDAVELVGDVVELELEQDTAVAQAKLNLIQGADAAEAPLAIRPGDVDRSEHLLACLQVAYAAPDELASFEDAWFPGVGHYTLQPTGLGQERAAELRAAALKKAVALCDEELTRMPSSLADDEAEVSCLFCWCVWGLFSHADPRPLRPSTRPHTHTHPSLASLPVTPMALQPDEGAPLSVRMRASRSISCKATGSCGSSKMRESLTRTRPSCCGQSLLSSIGWASSLRCHPFVPLPSRITEDGAKETAALVGRLGAGGKMR